MVLSWSRSWSEIGWNSGTNSIARSKYTFGLGYEPTPEEISWLISKGKDSKTCSLEAECNMILEDRPRPRPYGMLCQDALNNWTCNPPPGSPNLGR
ncbi:hypothetical protein H5410_037798 [Solanum commersonii]|uniref:Uncharacterized protein n=1 Tax=Solanum commersonii TaxID=4109 RepID=A0A9J5YC72_SOLCO|nr:hypothetical protein H5410_037798 [Solanum commersonii]